MPNYNVTSPDGKQFTVTAPEGASPEQIKAYAQSKWSSLQDGSNQTPFTLPPNPHHYSMKGESGTIDVPDAPEAQTAAAKGIDVLSGLPDPSINTLIDFASTPEEKAAALKGKLTQIFGKPVPVRASSTGDLEYLNPQTNRWTWRNPTRQANYTVPGMISTGGQVLGGTGGGILGAMTGSPYAAGAGSIAGSSVGGAVAGAINNKIATSLGYNDQLASAILEGGKEGAINAVAGEVVLGSARLLKYFVRGERFPFKLQDTKTLLMHADEAQQRLKDFYELGGSAGFKPTVPNLVGAGGDNSRLAQLADAKYRQATATSQSAAIEHNIGVDQNLAALKNTFEQVTDRFRGPDPTSGPVPNPKDVVDKLKTADLANTVAAQQMAEANAKAAAAGLPVMTDSQIRSEIDSVVNGAYQQAKGETDKAYTGLRVAMGVKPEYLDPVNRSPYLGGFPSSIQISPGPKLHTELGSYRARIASIRKLDSARADAMEALIPDKLNLNDPTTTFDSNDLLSYIQDLKDGVRTSYAVNKGLKMAPSEKDTQDMVNMLQGWLHDSWTSYGRTDLVAMHEEAMRLAKYQNDNFEHGILSRIIKRDEGVKPAIDDQVISTALDLGDGQSARALVNILHGAPEELNRMKQVVLAKYLNDPKYFDASTGIPTTPGLNKFMVDYGPVLREMFNTKDMKKLADLQTFAGVFEHASSQTDALVKAWNATPLAKAGSLNADTLSDQVLNNRVKANLSQGTDDDVALQGIWNTLDDASPELTDKVRQLTARKIFSKVTDPEGNPSAQAFGRLLDNPRVTAKLNTVMGEQYVKDLRAIRSAARVSEYSSLNPGGIALSKDTPLLRSIMRIETGYLGSKGIAYSTLLRFRDQAQSRAFQNMLSDPDMLRRVVQAQNLSLGSPVVAAILSDLNASYLRYSAPDKLPKVIGH